MTSGLVIGKFWPPHAGHRFLVDTVAAHCDRVFVIVCAAPRQVPSGSERAIWMQASYPHAEVVVVDDLCAWHYPEPCHDQCSSVWASRISSLGINPINLVGTSESYGEQFAQQIGAVHLSVDPDREVIPISSTKLRSDLGGHWHRLSRAVKAGLTRKIVVLGAESTGTSTLARDLSLALRIPCVAEAGRTLSWELYAHSGDDMGNVVWSEKIFWDIVNKQIALEHHAREEAIDHVPSDLGPWIVCDTDTLATVAWWERYLGTKAEALLGLASVRLADLYLITDPADVPFDDSDPLRDGAAIRLGMHERMIELMSVAGRPWLLVGGTRTERTAKAIEALKAHEASHPRWLHH